MHSYMTIQDKLLFEQLKNLINQLIEVHHSLDSVIPTSELVMPVPDEKEMKIDFQIKTLQTYSKILHEKAQKKYNQVVEQLNIKGANIEEGNTFLSRYDIFSRIEFESNERLKKSVETKKVLQDFKHKVDSPKLLIREISTPKSKTGHFVKKIGTISHEELLKKTKDLVLKYKENCKNEEEIQERVRDTNHLELENKIAIRILHHKNIRDLEEGENINPISRLAYLFLKDVYTEEKKGDAKSEEQRQDINPIIQVLNTQNLSDDTRCEVIEELIRLDYDLLNQRDKNDHTPLEYLIFSSDSDQIQYQGSILNLVKILVNNGAYLGLTNGHSPIRFAMSSQHHEASDIVKYLLEAGGIDPKLSGAISNNEEKINFSRKPISIKTGSVQSAHNLQNNEKKLRVDINSARFKSPLPPIISESPLSGVDSLKDSLDEKSTFFQGRHNNEQGSHQSLLSFDSAGSSEKTKNRRRPFSLSSLKHSGLYCSEEPDGVKVLEVSIRRTCSVKA